MRLRFRAVRTGGGVFLKVNAFDLGATVGTILGEIVVIVLGNVIDLGIY